MEKQKLKIGIDLDEVVVEYVRHFLDFYNEKFQTSFSFNDIKSYSIEDHLKIPKEKLIVFSEEVNSSEFIESQDFIDGAVKSIEDLSEQFEIFFVTSRPAYLRERTFKFLKKNFPDIIFKLIFSRDYFGEDVSKSNICDKEKISIFLEDRFDYAFECAEKEIKVILFDKPWNNSGENHKNIFRVKNWKEAIEKIGEIKNEH